MELAAFLKRIIAEGEALANHAMGNVSWRHAQRLDTLITQQKQLLRDIEAFMAKDDGRVR